MKKMNGGRKLRTVDIPNHCNLAIYPQSRKINSELLFQIRSHGDKSIEDYIQLKGLIHDFLNFVTVNEVFVEFMYGIIEPEDYRSKVVILYRSTNPKPANPDQRVMFKPSVTSLIFHYSEISTEFESILKRWFDIAEKLKHVYDSILWVLSIALTNMTFIGF